MMIWYLFPPETREGQFDEKWSFVRKKEKKCNPDVPSDERAGDNWDHVAYDPENRLVIAVVPGKRTAENAEKAVSEFRKRTDDNKINLITSDEYRSYTTAILNIYGTKVMPPRTGKPGRPKNPYTEQPKYINYATVHKIRENGRVVKIELRTVFGTDESIREALEKSAVSRQINTAFIERNNGTDRNRNGRKVRKTYCFSKDWKMHEAVTYFTMYSYNFCWEVRTLCKSDGHGLNKGRTPAMAAGLTDHVWTLQEWLAYPTVQRK